MHDVRQSRLRDAAREYRPQGATRASRGSPRTTEARSLGIVTEPRAMIEHEGPRHPGGLRRVARILRSADVGGRLAALRKEVAADRNLLATLEERAFAPIALPSRKASSRSRTRRLGFGRPEPRSRRAPSRLRGRPHRARPQARRCYIARSKFLPLVPLMTQTPSEALGLGGRHEVSRIPASSCAGRI